MSATYGSGSLEMRSRLTTMNCRRRIRVTILVVLLSVQTAGAFRGPEYSEAAHVTDVVPASREASLVRFLRLIVEIWSKLPSKADACEDDFNDRTLERFFGVPASRVCALVHPRSNDCQDHPEICGTPKPIHMTVEGGETMGRNAAETKPKPMRNDVAIASVRQQVENRSFRGAEAVRSDLNLEAPAGDSPLPL
jgi:hypothetical protein